MNDINELNYKKCYWKAAWTYTFLYILISIGVVTSKGKDDILLFILGIPLSSLLIPIISLAFYPIIHFFLFPFYRAFVEKINFDTPPSLTQHLIFGLMISSIPIIFLGLIIPPLFLILPPMPFAGMMGGYTLYTQHKKGHEIETSHPS